MTPERSDQHRQGLFTALYRRQDRSEPTLLTKADFTRTHATRVSVKARPSSRVVLARRKDL